MEHLTDKGKKTELEMLEELKGENVDLVEELIRRYRPLVASTARRVCPRLSRDEDLLQCGMIGLWRAAEVWDGVRPFSPLAKRCIQNEMLRHLRYLSRQARTVPLLPDEPRCYEEDFTRVELESDLARKFTPSSAEETTIALVLAGYPMKDAAQAAGASPRPMRRRLKRKMGRLLGERNHGWYPPGREVARR